MRKLRLVAALFLAMAMFATACGSGSSSTASDTDTTTESTDEESTDTESDTEEDMSEEESGDEMAEEESEDDMSEEESDDMAEDEGTADEGGDDAAAGAEAGTITMARATWTTENVNAEIYRQLLIQLGYDVSDPADQELDPSLAYLAMAQGDVDFWINGWFPGHQSWLEAEMPDGSKVGDHVSVLGEQMMAGGLQGFLVTKSVAEENGLTTLDQINSDPAITEVFDSDGDGKADIYGCPDSWTCDNIITEMICQFEWDNITQTQAGYDAMFAEAKDKANNGEPMVIYTWTPSSYVTDLVPGDNVMWLSVEGEVDGSNCAQQEGGEEYGQPNSVAAIGDDQCLTNEAGECKLGWTAADVLAAGNNEFLDANPMVKQLLTDVQIPLIDASLMNVDLDQTDGSTPEITEIANKWIADNQETVDGWLEAARAAG